MGFFFSRILKGEGSENKWGPSKAGFTARKINKNVFLLLQFFFFFRFIIYNFLFHSTRSLSTTNITQTKYTYTNFIQKQKTKKKNKKKQSTIHSWIQQKIHSRLFLFVCQALHSTHSLEMSCLDKENSLFVSLSLSLFILE